MWLWVADEWIGPTGAVILFIAWTQVPQAFLPLFVAIGTAAIVIRIQSRILTKDVRNHATAQGSLVECARVVCYGSPAELSELARVPKYSFEPLIVRALRNATNIRFLDPVNSRAFGTAVWVLLIFVIGQFFSLSSWALLLLLMALGMGAPWAMSNRNALYYRVVPGRVEILKCTLFGRIGKCNSISLRSGTVTVRYDKQWIEVREGKTSLRIDLGGVARRHLLVSRIIQAVLCEDKVPPLPSDQLLG